WVAFAGSLAGSGAGTAGSMGVDYLAYKDKPTWQGAAIAFGSATAGALAGAAVRDLDRSHRLAQIQEKMDSELRTSEGRQAVIRYAEEQLQGEGVDVGAATYDPRLNDNAKYADALALTDPRTGNIYVGDGAFEDAMTLASTLVHENVHRHDFINWGLRPISLKEASQTEMRAYSRGLEFVRDYGGHVHLEQNNLDKITAIRDWQSGKIKDPPW
ncbi:MAG TPA: hypothetical protein VIV60_33740, partial [Polyangiaceae bacterium]